MVRVAVLILFGAPEPGSLAEGCADEARLKLRRFDKESTREY
jgi:hypothetical protein